MFKAVITTVVMALSEKQKNCSSDKTTTVCGDSSESLQLPTKPHSRGCESTYNKVLFTPPTMCRLTFRPDCKLSRFCITHFADQIISAISGRYRLSRRNDQVFSASFFCILPLFLSISAPLRNAQGDKLRKKKKQKQLS